MTRESQGVMMWDIPRGTGFPLGHHFTLVLSCPIRKVLDHRDKVYEQLAKYLQLRNVIERLQVKMPGLGTVFLWAKEGEERRYPRPKPVTWPKSWPLIPTSFSLAPQEANHSELYMQVDLGCNFFVDTVVWVSTCPSEPTGFSFSFPSFNKCFC